MSVGPETRDKTSHVEGTITWEQATSILSPEVLKRNSKAISIHAN